MEHEGEAPTKPFGFVGTSPSFLVRRDVPPLWLAVDHAARRPTDGGPGESVVGQLVFYFNILPEVEVMTKRIATGLTTLIAGVIFVVACGQQAPAAVLGE